MKTILVTGGAGFIGSHLCKKLLQSGNKVICLDNMSTGSYDNIVSMLPNRNFKFYNANIVDALQFDANEIYNLACPASPTQYQQDPIMTLRTCFLGALNVLELAKNLGARVLQASTSEIYGDPLIHPQFEDYNGNVDITGPRACYDEGKRIAETLFFDYKRKYGVDICVVRIFNTYGPNMLLNDGRVMPNFIAQALQDKDITVYGSGLQTRSFCYIDDLVSGLITAMGKNNFSGPINLGNPYEMTILDLANLIIKLINSNSNIIHMKLPMNDPAHRKPDIGMARAVLGWRPHTSIEEGVEKTIKYFEEKYKF